MPHDIIDNRTRELAPEIVNFLADSVRAHFAVGYFFLSGFEAIAAQIPHLDRMRLLIGNVTNRQTIEPITVTSGGAHYPTEEAVQETYRGLAGRFHLIAGTAIAEEMGNARAANVVLLGALSTLLEVPVDTWLQVIERRVPPKYVELNRQAFLRGREAME